MIHYLTTNSTDPFFNLAFEEYIFDTKTAGTWLILWQNENSVIIGMNQNPMEEVNLQYAETQKINVVRRMTGGGAVYHDLGNLNFSVISDVKEPGKLEISSYNRPICDALKNLGLSPENTGKNDIVIDGRKISGVAQRICSGRILHHGCILFDTNIDKLSCVLTKNSGKYASKNTKSIRSRVTNIRPLLDADMDMSDFKGKILNSFSIGGCAQEYLSDNDLACIQQIADSKYRTKEWTWGRQLKYSYRNKRRFKGGDLEVEILVEGGKISNIQFYGDFMATRSCDDICNNLCGSSYNREAVAKVLESSDLVSAFGSISQSDILSIMIE